MALYPKNLDSRIEKLVREALTALNDRIQASYQCDLSEQAQATTTLIGIPTAQWLDDLREIARAEARPEELSALGNLMNAVLDVINRDQLVEYKAITNESRKIIHHSRITPLGNERRMIKLGGRDTIKILFLAANPSQTPSLDLEEELRSLEQELRGVKFRDSITLIARHAVRPDDLIRHVREDKPNVIHFSGHGMDRRLASFSETTLGGIKPSKGQTLSVFSKDGESISLFSTPAIQRARRTQSMVRSRQWSVQAMPSVTKPPVSSQGSSIGHSAMALRPRGIP